MQQSYVSNAGPFYDTPGRGLAGIEGTDIIVVKSGHLKRSSLRYIGGMPVDLSVHEQYRSKYTRRGSPTLLSYVLELLGF